MQARENIDGSPDHGPAEVPLSERLAYYRRVLRRRWRVIALVPAVAVAISLVVGLQAQKKYDATAKLVVNPSNQVNALLNPSSANPSADPERDLNTEVSRIKTFPLAEAVRRDLRLSETDKVLLGQVTTSIEGTTNVVDIKVRDTDPARAAALANAFATRYVVVREKDARRAFQQAATQARDQLESLSPVERSSPQGLQLASRLQELEVDSTLQTGNAEVIQRATTPTSAASPRVLFGVGLAALLGLVLGVVAATVLELLDRRVKDEEDVSLITGMPSLASIPRPPRRTRRGSSKHRNRLPIAHSRRARRNRPLELGPAQTEGYRSLATSLRFFKLGDKVKTLMIASPSPLAGKTTVTLSLAATLAELGQRVIAVECDLRRPSFADYLELSRASGLSSILAGMSSLSQEIADLDVTGWQAAPAIGQGEYVQFSVLPGGPAPPNPHALLSSPEMAELLLELRRSSADVVLIDTPPLGLLTDAVPLIPQVDGVALVVRLQHTTRDELKKACGMLAELDAPTLGKVLTGGPALSLSGYYGGVSPAPAPTGLGDESHNGRAGSQRSEGAPTSPA
jgi:capsular exopolysaccharide synthesis family protein